MTVKSELPRFFINANVHTEQLRTASLELLDVDLKVVEECAAHLEKLNPVTSPVQMPILLRSALSPIAVSDRTEKKWYTAEKWVTRLLVEAGSLDYPEKAMKRATEFMESTRRISSVDQARGYLNLTRARLNYLASYEGQLRLDTLRFSAMTFVSNGLLRNAIHNGIYAPRAEGY